MNLTKGQNMEEKLRLRKNESLRLQEYFHKYMTLLEGTGAEMAFEWPSTSEGWKVCDRVKEWCRKPYMKTAKFNGCMLDVKCKTTGLPLKKGWRIMMTCEELATEMAKHKCDRTHLHGKTEGQNTSQSGFYPR